MCILLPAMKLQKCAGRQFVYVLVNRIRRRDRVVAQKQRQRIAVDFGAERRVRLERLEFRAEQEGLALPAVIQWFFTQTVAGKREHSRLAIPQRKSKHAYTLFERCRS